MPKRLIVCCDGTWNTPDQASKGQPSPTNVAKFALALATASRDGWPQQVFYLRGVGTRALERLRGGALGFGLSRNVRDAYRVVAEAFEPGDEIFLLGFSRGAFTARSTAGFIRNAGVLRSEHLDRIDQAYALYRDANRNPDHIESRLFRASFSHETRIRFIGVWDTVGALGIPLPGNPLVDLINKRWGFHDTQLSSTVDGAFHAVAIDEHRKPFLPTLWQQSADPGEQRLEQVWFTGVHCDVGGGYPLPESGLSDIALGWMMERAGEYQLAFREGSGPSSPDPMGKLHDSLNGLYRRLGPVDRPIGKVDPASEYVASTAVDRYTADPSYRPPQLTRYLEDRGQTMPVPS
jgi:uncharacterized protein (DUF2235 family)